MPADLVVKPSQWRRSYSGEDSHAFWAAINKTDDALLYELACELQNTEYKVLRFLEDKGDGYVE